MKIKLSPLLLFIFICAGASFAVFSKGNSIPVFPPLTMVNNVSFFDSTYNNSLAGCSFLIETEKGIFAVTCKHALWVAKSKEMTGIHFEETLKEWRMQRKDDHSKYVITGKLLNENRKEKIGDENVKSDYLLFTVSENRSDVTPLRLRETPLEAGEALYLIGWTFKDTAGGQRVIGTKFHRYIQGKLLIEPPENINLAGMSGAPVVDAEGFLVGIVSDYYFDEETKRWYMSPCSLDYLKSLLATQ